MSSAARSAPRLGLWIAAAVLAALAIEATAPPIAIYDEGVVLASVFRFAAGELPWRDYDPVYGALEPLLLWPTVRAFGAELLALRLERALFAAGLVALLGAATLRLGGGRAAALVAAAAVARRTTVLVHPALPLLVATAWWLASAERAGSGSRAEDDAEPGAEFAARVPRPRRGTRRLLLAGLCAGAAGLARLEFGGLAVLVGLATLTISAWARRGAGRELARDALAFAAGGVPALLALGALISAAGFGAVSAHFEAMGALVEHRGAEFPLPPPEGTPWTAALDMFAVFGLPLLIVPVALLVALARAARARRDRSAPPTLLLALALAGAGTLPYALSRPDLLHFVPPYAIACALGVAALGPLERRLSARARTVALVAAAAALVVPLGLRARSSLALRAEGAPSELPGVRGVVLPPAMDATWTKTVEAVQQVVPEGEPLYVGCTPHDRIHINDGLLYVLCRRPIATRHHCFNPGVTTTVEKQREMVRELEAASPRAIVLVAGLTGPARRDPAGSELLDRWLARRYERVKAFGGYGIFVRR